MTTIKFLKASALAAGLLLSVQGAAEAHCDSLDGPVARAAQAALETGNANLALPYAPASAEDEIRARFAEAIKVRALGPEARALADRAFIETTVRLHRAGEGAPYTGLKPTGTDFGPAIPLAEKAVETGNMDEIRALLGSEMEHGLEARFAHVLHAANAPDAPQTPAQVAAARERVSAELGFVTYVEGLRQAFEGAAHEHVE